MRIPQKYHFIVQLGKALHTYGVPSYKSQAYLTEIAKQHGIKGSFMDSPTWINYVFYEEDEQTYNYVECVPPGEINLGALSKIIEITDNVIDNKLTFSQARQAIIDIENAPIGYGKIAEMLAFMLSAGAFSIILDTSWFSALVAALIGAIIYAITLWSHKSNYISSTLESLVAFVATITTGILSLYFNQLNISMVILASIIIFIPGLSITTALEEITSRSLVAGTAKLFDALVSLFKQFFGVMLGLAVMPLFFTINPQTVVNDIPQWFDFIAIPTLALCLTIVFKVRPRDIILCILSGFICFYITIIFDFTGILVSTFIGTIATVYISKLFSHFTRSPRLVYLIPGIVMLVPGSKAFIGLSSLFISSSSSPHTNMGEQVLYILMGIIGGLIFSGSFALKKREIEQKPINTHNQSN